MVVNSQSTSVTVPAGTPVATANEQDIISINKPNSELEQIQFSHCDQTEEVSTLEATSDSKEHKNKLLSDSAILNTDPIPERHDITKRAPTISDKELLEKFHLDHLEQSVRNKVKKLILQFRPIWSEHPFDLGLHRYIKHNIVLTGDLPPCPKQRFWPANRREAAEQLIDNLQKFDIVSKTVTDWATNIVLIKKQAPPAEKAMEQTLLDDILDKKSIPTPISSKYRLCLDLRPTNSVTKPDVATLGHMDSLFMHLAGKPVRSTFDFSNSFFQIGLTEESKGVTFFVSRKSGSCIMKFNRSIQGSRNASSVFTRAMEISFQGLERCASYWVDDLVTYSDTVKQHLADLELIFARVLDSNMKLNPDKAEFMTGKVKYLGMMIEGDTFSIADRKLETITSLPAPKTKKELVSQFALFQYYKKFIPAFSDIAKPLQALLKGKTPFKWTAACDEAHERMKTTFSCKISLHLPTSQDTFHLHTDASSYAAAAVLSQVQKEGSVPIAFYSKAFDETQMRYSILDKELYAMVNAIKHFEFYLQGRKFKIFTDSKILYYLREAKESNPKLMRWSLLLQDYDFDITHISGKSNKIADILSRVSHNQEEDVSRRIHTAKKEILQKIRDQVEEMDIPNGMTLSMSEMNTMVVANTSHQHQAGALLQHHFHRLHDPMSVS